MPSAIFGCEREINITFRVEIGACVPEANERFLWVIPKVLDTAFRADNRVIPLSIGRVMALLVGSKNAVIKLHQHHADVFDVHNGVHPSLCQRRPGCAECRITPL